MYFLRLWYVANRDISRYMYTPVQLEETDTGTIKNNTTLSTENRIKRSNRENNSSSDNLNVMFTPSLQFPWHRSHLSQYVQELLAIKGSPMTKAFTCMKIYLFKQKRQFCQGH